MYAKGPPLRSPPPRRTTRFGDEVHPSFNLNLASQIRRNAVGDKVQVSVKKYKDQFHGMQATIVKGLGLATQKYRVRMDEGPSRDEEKMLRY